MICLPVDAETQRARHAHRRATAAGETRTISEADHLHARAQFEEPDSAEREGRTAVEGPPAGWSDWREWAADRWPIVRLTADR